MQKLIETLKQFGIEIPADKQAEVKKALSEHYKNASEHEKTVKKLETERDSWKAKAETAEETLKKFEGIDPAEIQKEIETWKQKAADAEKNAQEQIYKRDFEDAMKTALEEVKFSSEAAKRDVMSQIKEAGLKLKDGTILGLTDLIEQIKKNDASAFVNEEEEKLKTGMARFTQPNKPGGAAATERERFAAMSLDERMALKASDPELYKRLRNS